MDRKCRPQNFLPRTAACCTTRARHNARWLPVPRRGPQAVSYRRLALCNADCVIVAAAMGNEHRFDQLITAVDAHADRLPTEGKDDATRAHDGVNRVADAAKKPAALCILLRHL